MAKSPVTTEEENALICEKLLGWKALVQTVGDVSKVFWARPHLLGNWIATPTFTDWASAGLILEALQAAGSNFYALKLLGGCHWHADMGSLGAYVAPSGPLAIRTAALVYLKHQLSTNQ